MRVKERYDRAFEQAVLEISIFRSKINAVALAYGLDQKNFEQRVILTMAQASEQKTEVQNNAGNNSISE